LTRYRLLPSPRMVLGPGLFYHSENISPWHNFRGGRAFKLFAYASSLHGRHDVSPREPPVERGHDAKPVPQDKSLGLIPLVIRHDLSDFERNPARPKTSGEIGRLGAFITFNLVGRHRLSRDFHRWKKIGSQRPRQASSGLAIWMTACRLSARRARARPRMDFSATEQARFLTDTHQAREVCGRLKARDAAL
jgi:hypothetical protein